MNLKNIIESNIYGSMLNEVAILFGGKKETQFNQVVILAGGAGSGKGFIKDNLVGIQGKTFDVDALKKAAMDSNLLFREKKIKDMNLDLGNAADVKLLHAMVVELGLERKLKSTVFKSILATDPRRKPNMIFDVTLKNVSKLKTITDAVKELGYDKENIHVVWVLTEIDVAIRQNMERERKVPVDILMDTHRGVATVMKGIFSGIIQARNYMDGKFVIVPNVKNVDNDVKFSGNAGNFFNRKKEQSGYFFGKKKDTYFVVKERGKAFIPFKDLSEKLRVKIKQYVPKGTVWGDSINSDDLN